jgi:hypothetical protein
MATLKDNRDWLKLALKASPIVLSVVITYYSTRSTLERGIHDNARELKAQKEATAYYNASFAEHIKALEVRMLASEGRTNSLGSDVIRHRAISAHAEALVELRAMATRLRDLERKVR